MTMQEDNFESLFTNEGEEITAEKIVAMFFNPKDINMKTEMPDQCILALAVLDAYVPIMKKMGLKKSAKFTASCTKFFKQLMVSRNREGRKEGTQMLGAIRQQVQKTGALAKILGVSE